MGSATRKEREKQLRRQMILEAARVVFAAKGFRGATMEAIAEKAGYKPATLYLYFTSKDELYASLIVSLLHFLADQFDELTSRDDMSPLQKLDELQDVLMRIYHFDPVMLVNMFRMQASMRLSYIPPEMLSEFNRVAGMGIRGLARIFEQGASQGFIQSHHPMALADSVWSLFTGVVIWEESKRFFNPDKQYVESTLRTALDLMFKSLVNKKI